MMATDHHILWSSRSGWSWFCSKVH